jgi:lysophospholipase L1-like esterase
MLLLILFIALFGFSFYLWQKEKAKELMQPPKNYPNVAAIQPNKKILVCAGDSLTHGNVSYDWVKYIEPQLPDYQIFNAGINADLSYTLLNRLDYIIAMKPDHINILIGCNDIVANSIELKENDRYFEFNKIPLGTKPTLESYQENMKAILVRLKNETTASISLMSIAPIGEDLASPIYKKVENYNETVKILANTDGTSRGNREGVTFLTLHEKMADYLQLNKAQSRIPFEKTRDATFKSAVLNILLGWDWDKITHYQKHLLTFDNLHFNSVGGKMIGDLLVEHLKEDVQS